MTTLRENLSLKISIAMYRINFFFRFLQKTAAAKTQKTLHKAACADAGYSRR